MQAFRRGNRVSVQLTYAKVRGTVVHELLSGLISVALDDDRSIVSVSPSLCRRLRRKNRAGLKLVPSNCPKEGER